MRQGFAAAGALILISVIVAPAMAQGGGGADDSEIDEIVVTALKRGQQALSDVPASISAFEGDDLERIGADSLAEFLQSAPGVTVIETQTGNSSIQIRGISALVGDATVGYYLDELPFSFLGNQYLPDTRTYDLERVEILRGPQGTLYGAGSMGGTVRILTNNPNLREFEAKGDFAGSSTDGAESENSVVSGAVNIPLVQDKLGVRLVSSFSDLAGWIDDPGPNNPGEDINGVEIGNYRAKVLFKPAQNFSLTGSAWISRVDGGSSNVSTFDHKRPRTAGPPEISRFDSDLYSLVAEYELPNITLFNALSRMDYVQDTHSRQNFDFHSALDIQTITDEFRASSRLAGPFNFLIGGFFGDVEEHINSEFALAAGVPLTPLQRDVLTSESWAVFGELYYEPAGSRAEFTLGLRYFEDERVTDDFVNAAAYVALGLPNPRQAKFDTLNPRFNVAYHLNDDSLIYFNAAKGFRSGALQPGPSLIRATLISVPIPTEIEPEDLWSYEIGAKVTSLFDRKVDVEGAVYYNDWKDLILVLPLADQPVGFAVNGPAARAYGVDFGVTVRLVEGLSLRAGGNFNNAEFTESLSVFTKGTRIDNVPAVTLSGSADYIRPIGRTLHAVAHLDLQFNDERHVRGFLAGGTPTTAKSEEITFANARIGIESDRWAAALFVDNLLDEDNAMSTFSTTVSPESGLGARLRPRTIGIHLRANY